MTDTCTDDTEQFEFGVGDGLVKKDSGVRIEGVGSVEDNTTVYYVKHCLVSPDSGKAFYHVKWEEETPHDPHRDVKVKRMLKNAEMVHNLYCYVGSDTDQ